MTPGDLKYAVTVAPRACEWGLLNLRSLARTYGCPKCGNTMVEEITIGGPRSGVPASCGCGWSGKADALDAPARMPHLDRASAPAVLIVGAGPTLDLGRVKAASDAGVSIWTVNNAAKAVCSVVRPDVVVVRESLDVSAQLDDLAHYPALVAVDLHAHPNVWAKALAQGDAAFFIPANLQDFAIAAALDVAPVYAGTASLTAAVALAAAGGAQWIGLEGVDLAYARDGQAYADGARYAAKLEGVDEQGLGRLSGSEAQQALAQASGHDGPPMLQAMTRVHARDGGEHLYAQGPWLDQIEWLENFAARRPAAWLTRGLGLADLVGWVPDADHENPSTLDLMRGLDLAAAMKRESRFTTDRSPINPDRLTALLSEFERQILVQQAINHAVLSGEDPGKIPGFVEGSPICDVHSAGARHMANAENAADQMAGMRAVYGAFGASAERLAAVR